MAPGHVTRAPRSRLISTNVTTRTALGVACSPRSRHVYATRSRHICSYGKLLSHVTPGSAGRGSAGASSS
eukprot:2660121-Rhodomonas_salina.2